MSGATQGRAGKVPKLAADSRAAVSWKDVNNIDLDAAGNVLLTRWTTADEPHHLVRDAMRNETPLHSDDAVITPSQLLAEALLSQLRVLSAGIAHFDAEIASLAPQLPDYELFAALPGAGPTLAPRLLAAFGERRERFPNAAALQNFAGIAPVIERSGNKCWVHWRYSCSKFLRQTFLEWGGQTIPRSFWAKAFYETCRARGSRHQAALRSLAFKWIRILHRCWVDRAPYDESRYLMALQKRGAPLLKHAAQNAR